MIDPLTITLLITGIDALGFLAVNFIHDAHIRLVCGDFLK